MYRLKRHSPGRWIVEQRKPSWTLFGMKYKWVHVTHYLGMPDKPFYYSTPEDARDGALAQIKDSINFSFKYA